jgi:hypothetical protein
MKSSNLPPNTALLLIALLICTFVGGKFLLDQSDRHRRLQSELLSISLKSCKLDELQKASRKSADVVRQKIASLREYEKTLPLADGYVQVSRIMMEAVPKFPLIIDPPDMSQDLVRSPEYCSGLFRIRGTGRLDDCLAVLRKADEALPFSRVQDLQIVFTDPKEMKVEFAFSLMTVMRLGDDASFNDLASVQQ